MLHEFTNSSIFHRMPATAARPPRLWLREPEAALMARFAWRINALGPLRHASPALQARVLEEVRAAALRFDPRGDAGSPEGYTRRVLYEAPERWSLVAIVLLPGQETHPHNHSGWGCAVTVQGVERDRRFINNTEGEPVLSEQRDYPPGAGYLFDPTIVHQPLGAHPRQVTVALHFLVQEPGVA